MSQFLLEPANWPTFSYHVLLQPHDEIIKGCIVSIAQYKTKSVAFGSRHLSVSRLLQSQILSLDYDFSLNVTCPNSGCNVDSITSTMQEAVSQFIITSIENNDLLAGVSEETNAVALLSGAMVLESEDDSCSCASPTSTVSGTTVTTNTHAAAWYPLWGATDKCSNAPGIPHYMKDSPHYNSICE